MADELHYLRTDRGEVCTQGAQILRWRGKDGRDVLFVSKQSRFEAGKPIRGGIPVIFPWFGEDPAGVGKAHGVVRRREWKVVDGDTDLQRGRIALELGDGSKTRKEWDHAFRLRLLAELGDELAIDVAVENRNEQALAFEFSLHCYFAVGDVRRIAIRGLEGVTFVDHLDGGVRSVQPQAPVTITRESERFFHGSEATCTIEDPVLRRRIEIERRGLRSTLVWHPWQEKAAGMSDFGADEWTSMVCVEPANVREDKVTLAAGATHRMQVRIRELPF